MIWSVRCTRPEFLLEQNIMFFPDRGSVPEIHNSLKLFQFVPLKLCLDSSVFPLRVGVVNCEHRNGFGADQAYHCARCSSSPACLSTNIGFFIIVFSTLEDIVYPLPWVLLSLSRNTGRYRRHVLDEAGHSTGRAREDQCGEPRHLQDHNLVRKPNRCRRKR